MIKYTSKFTIGIELSEFMEYANPLVPKKELRVAIKDELYQSWCGIVSGEWGGTGNDWKKVFYYNLYKSGIIEQTELCKEVYGLFKK